VLREKHTVLMVVHDEELFWLSTDSADQGRCLWRLPLETVMEGPIGTPPFPETIKGNNKFLCLVPDHWFGTESYPFKSNKPNLIEPFLIRKLSAGHPNQHAIGQFFNYKKAPANDGSDNLHVYYLNEAKAYRLNSALRKANLAPLGFTTPAFLWEEILNKASRDFGQAGSLLVHMDYHECRLCFYFNGSYQFSRNVVLPGDAEKIGAITYEINQSLYLFSQKTKSELKQIYLLASDPTSGEALGEALGRDLIDCATLIPANQRDLVIPEVPFLSGLLPKGQFARAASVFSVIHRRVRRQREWKPVQLTGIAVGLLLVLLLLGEAFILDAKQGTAEDERRQLQHQMRASAGMVLADYAQALEQVMQRIDRPSCGDVALLTMASLPVNARLKELDLALTPTPVIKVTALVDAQDTDQLRATLAQLITNLKTNFTRMQPLSISDIDVGPAPGDDDQGLLPRFTIAFQLELA
jgi:hypothetical protein